MKGKTVSSKVNVCLWFLQPIKGVSQYLYSFIGPVGHNLWWWENTLNESFRPKSGLIMILVAKVMGSRVK